MFSRKYKENEKNKILLSIVVIVDTREKACSHIIEWLDKKGIKYIRQSLKFGDYSFMIPKNDKLDIPEDIYFINEVVFERKANLEELSTNLSKHRERFKKEFEKAQGKMTLIIEDSSYEDIWEGNYKSGFPPKSYIASLHSLSDRYNIPFTFIDKEYTPKLVFFTFYYHLKNLLK